MNVLVTVASKHGGTRGIADTIASELRDVHFEVDVAEIAADRPLRDYDAVVLGSAIYMGRWLADARAYVDEHRDELRQMPVWLFSSGPLGAEDPLPPGEWPQAEELVAALGAREHRTFAGRLEAEELGLGERLIAKALHTPYGDFRDWDEIRGWAQSIGGELRRIAGRMAVP